MGYEAKVGHGLVRGVVRHYATAGWPRATQPWVADRDSDGERTVQMPVPWLNAYPDDPTQTDWTAFRSEGLVNAHARGCLVCGLVIDGPIYLCAQDGREATSGNGCHARCAALAVKFCPNLNSIEDGGTVAWRYDGPGIGVDLPALGAADPMWGDHDPIDAACTPLTRAELLADVKAADR